jgi:hypothetical protein
MATKEHKDTKEELSTENPLSMEGWPPWRPLPSYEKPPQGNHVHPRFFIFVFFVFFCG